MLAAGLAGTAQADPEAQAAVAVVPPCLSVVAGAPIIVPNDFLPPPISDTRTAGHYELSGTSLHVFTDDATSQAKVAEYVSIAPTPLSSAGEPALAWTGSATAPGLQLIVDLENDGTADGALVGEPASYGNRWWANGTLRAHIGVTVPPALVSPGGDGSPVAGTLSDWLGAYPSTQVVGVGFSLGSGVKGDGLIGSLTFACVSRSFAAPAPATPLEFSQTEFFGSTVAGSTATASYLVSSGPTGESTENCTIVIGIDFVTAAELASCTVAVDGGPAAPAVIEYDPTVDGVTYSGALIYVADGLVIEPGFALTIDIVCATTSGAVLDDYALSAAFTYGKAVGAGKAEAAAIVVEPGTVGTLPDVLSIVGPVVVTTAPTATPTPSAAVLAATGPAETAGALRLGLIALLAGLALVGAGAVRRTGRQH